MYPLIVYLIDGPDLSGPNLPPRLSVPKIEDQRITERDLDYKLIIPKIVDDNGDNITATFFLEDADQFLIFNEHHRKLMIIPGKKPIPGLYRITILFIDDNN